MSEALQKIPAEEGVRRVGAGEGEKFDIAGAHLMWKVKALDSAYQFSVCEMTLAPGEGVPVHSHTSAEAFYVLTGTVDFYRVNAGKEDWLNCSAMRFRISDVISMVSARIITPNNISNYTHF
jgi:predicted metal-dependent enzyme (double-stranded beta helix superfamily)